MLITQRQTWKKCLPLFSLLLVVSGCGGQPTNLPSNSLHAETPLVNQISVADAVSEVEHYSGPANLPLLAELKGKLVKELLALGTDKIVSTPPRGAGNNVADLAINNDTAQLGWTYVNIGDYDQNSEVNVADLTPVAVYFGMTPADTDWINAVVADGDTNLEVNLADITPIAVHFTNSVTAYNVYTSSDIGDVPVLPSDQNGPRAALAETIIFDDANEPPGFKTFTQVLSAPIDLNWYWVRPTDGSELGAASNAVQFEEPAVLNIPPTADLSAAPLLGDLPLIVDFDATLSTDSDGTIVLFEWDWDGAVGGLNWESTGATGTAQHTYGLEGTYSATVRVTDNLGATDTANVEIVVNEPIFTGLTISGTLVYLEGLMGVPIPDVEVHLQGITNPSYYEIIVTDEFGVFEFTNVPADNQYSLWGEDPAWQWPGPRPIPNAGLLTENHDAGWLLSNGAV